MAIATEPRERLRFLDSEIRRLKSEISEKTETGQRRMQQVHAESNGSLAEFEAGIARRVLPFFDEAETLTAHVQALEAEAKQIMAQLSGGSVARDSGGPPINFVSELQLAHQALLRGQPGIFGQQLEGSHALDVDGFPMAGIPDYRIAFGDVGEFLRDKFRVASLFPTVSTSARTIVDYKVTSPADQAAAVAEGAPKPESDPGWSPITTEIQVIGHVATASNQMLQDYTSWEQLVAREMVGGLIEEENAQLLNGNGVAPNLEGILHTTGIGSINRDATNSETKGEAIHRGLTWVSTHAFTESDAILLHPSDLEAVRFERAAPSGVYLFGTAGEADPTQLWGVPLKTTTRVPIGTAIVGNFMLAGKVYVRQGASLEVNPWYGGADGAGWDRNQTRLRCEERIGLAIIQPSAICSIDIS